MDPDDYELSVSYTPLDVYKRQIINRITSRYHYSKKSPDFSSRLLLYSKVGSVAVMTISVRGDVLSQKTRLPSVETMIFALSSASTPYFTRMSCRASFRLVRSTRRLVGI